MNLGTRKYNFTTKLRFISNFISPDNVKLLYYVIIYST